MVSGTCQPDPGCSALLYTILLGTKRLQALTLPAVVEFIGNKTDYAKYIKEADTNRDFVEKQIEKSATLVKPASEVDHSPALQATEKAPD